MSYNCGSSCKRKTGARREICCRPGAGGHTLGQDSGTRHHAIPQQVWAAVDMYFDGLSYRRVAENVGEYFGRPTSVGSVYSWVHESARRANDVVKEMKVDTGAEWVVDEIAVKVGGKQYWLFAAAGVEGSGEVEAAEAGGSVEQEFAAGLEPVVDLGAGGSVEQGLAAGSEPVVDSAAGGSVEQEFAEVEVGAWSAEAVVDLEGGDVIDGADSADLAADAGVGVAASGGGGAKRPGWLGWLGWLGGLGVLGAGIALGVFYYATTPDTPEEAGERYIESHYDAIAEALVRTVLVRGGLPGELLAEVGESVAERVVPYSCELPELGDVSAGPEDVRCVLSFGLRKPVELVVEAPLNVRLDWKRRDVFGRRAPVGLSSEVVPAGVRVNVFGLEGLERRWTWVVR